MRTLCAPQIQTIIKCEGGDTPDEPEEAYFFLTEWIHGVAADSENPQSSMRRRQRSAGPRAKPHFLGPPPELRKSLLGIPIGSMLWIPARHSVPHWQLFHRQVRERKRTLTPNEIFDFPGVLLEYSEVEVIEVEKVADFIRQSTGQFFRFTASRDRFTDAHHSLIAMAARFTRDDRYCVVHALFRYTNSVWGAGRRYPKIDDPIPLKVALF